MLTGCVGLGLTSHSSGAGWCQLHSACNLNWEDLDSCGDPEGLRLEPFRDDFTHISNFIAGKP